MSDTETSDLLGRLREDRDLLKSVRQRLHESRPISEHPSRGEGDSFESSISNITGDSAIAEEAGADGGVDRMNILGDEGQVASRVQVAEERARMIVAEAEERANQLLTAAEEYEHARIVVAGAEERASQLLAAAEEQERARKIVAEAEERANQLLAPAKNAVRVSQLETQEQGTISSSLVADLEDKRENGRDGVELFDAIESFIQTNSQLVHELGGLVGSSGESDPMEPDQQTGSITELHQTEQEMQGVISEAQERADLLLAAARLEVAREEERARTIVAEAEARASQLLNAAEAAAAEVEAKLTEIASHEELGSTTAVRPLLVNLKATDVEAESKEDIYGAIEQLIRRVLNK